MKREAFLVAGPVLQLDLEPPAGLSFDNLKPCLSYGQGYETLGQAYPGNIAFQSFNCKMRPTRGVRIVRFYQQNNAKSWSKWKLYLGMFPDQDSLHEWCEKKSDFRISGERKLRLAANTNDIDRLKTLLETGIDPRTCDEFQRTALHLAASKGYTDIVR